MEFKDLTPEQQEKARSCKTPEDVLALAKEEGYELSDEELAAVSGGRFWHPSDQCRKDQCWDNVCRGIFHDPA